MSLYSYDYAWFLNYHHEFELFGKSLLVPHMQTARRQPSHSFKASGKKKTPCSSYYPVNISFLYQGIFTIRRTLKTLRDQELCVAAHSFAVEIRY